MKESVLERMDRIDAPRRIADFNVKMQMDYEFKVKYAKIRAREFAAECERRDLNYHVSVGGLDSIILFLFLRSIGIDAPGISVSFLEDPSIQEVHRQLGIERLKPLMRDDGTLYTTGAQRTGCSMCGFGIHLEKRPHRFDLLRERNPREWEYIMYHLCKDDHGNDYGWGKVLDYIGVEWR